MDEPKVLPDPEPEEIDKEIVDIYRKNPTLQSYMSMYLAKQISYRECMEFTILKMAEELAGAHEGWRSALAKLPESDLPKLRVTKKPKLALVNEKTCPACSFSAWLSEDGAQGTGKVCAVCDAKRGANQYKFYVEQIKLAITEIAKQAEVAGVKLPQRLLKLLDKTNEPTPNQPTKRLPTTFLG
jgi:hypothetical protein